MYDRLNMKTLVTRLLCFTQKIVCVLDNYSCKSADFILQLLCVQTYTQSNVG